MHLINLAPLLSIGERQVLINWNQLSPSSKQLYIFLFHRKPKHFRREHIQYVDINKSHYFSNVTEEEKALKDQSNWDLSLNASIGCLQRCFWIVCENL